MRPHPAAEEPHLLTPPEATPRVAGAPGDLGRTPAGLPLPPFPLPPSGDDSRLWRRRGRRAGHGSGALPPSRFTARHARGAGPPRQASPRQGASARRLRRTAGLADQVMSSVSNLLAVVLVARALSAADFGRFSLGYAVLTMVLGLSRSYFGTRLSLTHDPRRAAAMTADLLGAYLLLVPVLPIVVFGPSAVASGGRSLEVLAIVALATPVVCAQDIIRFGAAAANRPLTALVSDSVWVVLMLVPFVVGRRVDSRTALGLWFAAAAVALVVALVMFGVRPDVRGGWRELRRRDPLGTSMTLGTFISTAGVLAVLAVVTSAIGPEAAGALRGASTAMGPLNVLFAFSALSLTPALVRRSRSLDRWFCSVTSAGLVAVAAVWGVGLLTVPAGWGAAAFGASWPGIRTVLPWTTAEYAGLSAATGALLGIKVRNLSRALLWQRTAFGAVMIGGGCAVAIGTRQMWPVAATLALAAWVSAGFGWVPLAFDRTADDARAVQGPGDDGQESAERPTAQLG